MKKDFILDKAGKVMNCDSNIAKYTIYEYFKYSRCGRFSFVFPVNPPTKELFISLIQLMLYAFQFIIPLGFILSSIHAKKEIRRSVKNVNVFECRATNR